jgi:AcrR family transcriptional regulator
VNPRDELLDRAVAWFAEHGIGDTSMRTLAAELGTSGRMLHYHFGSREGLLAAVVERVERGEQAVLAAYLAESADPFEAGARFWPHVAEAAQTFAPLFFELSAHAMHGRDYAAPLRAWLARGWVDEVAAAFVAAGVPADRADARARLAVATTRGLLLELAITGDRPAADRAMAEFAGMLRGAGGD